MLTQLLVVSRDVVAILIPDESFMAFFKQKCQKLNNLDFSNVHIFWVLINL